MSHVLGASRRAGGADAPAAVLGLHRTELAEQAGKAGPVGALVRYHERASVFMHVSLMLSMKEFGVPGLCSAGPLLSSGPPNLVHPLVDLPLLPLETFDTRSAEIRPRPVEGNQGGAFLFEEVFFLKIAFPSTLTFVIALLNPLLKTNELSRHSLCKAFFLFHSVP